MNLLNNIISKSEEKIRMHWLFSTFSLLILYPLALFSFFMPMRVPFPEAVLIGLIVYACTTIIPFWMIWYCAYKKYGTKLLSFWLFIIPIKTLASVGECLNEPLDVVAITFILMDVVVFFWWFLLSLKMKRINKSIQERLSLKKSRSSQVSS